MATSHAVSTDYITDYGYEQEMLDMQEATFAYATRNDGRWAAFFLWAIVFSPTILLPGNLPPFRPVDILILLLWPIRAIKTRHIYGSFFFSPRIRLFSLFIFGMTGVMIFSMAINVATGRNPFFVKDLFIPIVFIRMVIIAAITASFNIREKQIRQFYIGLLVIIALSVILAYGQKTGRFGIALAAKYYATEIERLEKLWTGFGRATGTFGNTNVFAGSLTCFSAIVLPLVVNVKGILKYIILAMLACVVYILLTSIGSRTSIVGFAFILAVALLLSIRKGSRVPTLIVMCIALVSLLFLRQYAQDLPLPERIKDMISPGRGEYLREGIYVRTQMWKHSFEATKESFIFGVGPQKTETQLTDNGYFFTLLRLGIIGLTLYLLMLWKLFFRGLKAYIKEERLLYRAFMLGFLMVLLTHMVFEVTGEFFWHVKYGTFFAALVGMFCGFSCQIITDYKYVDDNYQMTDETAVEL